MPYLTNGEIQTHLYGEVIDEVSRGDESNLQAAIEAAMSEAEGYLSAYDTVAVFSGENRNPILLLFVKDIAVWHYIQLANPSVDLELRRIRYDNAVTWLTKVQKGQTVPNLTYPQPPMDSNGDGYPDGYIKWGGNIKRNNNF